MSAPLIEAFILGLSMGPACLAYCSPVFVPLVASEKQAAWTGTARTVGLFLLGRLAGYTVVGTATGFVGSFLIGSVSIPAWAALRFVMGALMIASVWIGGRAAPGCGVRQGRSRMSHLLPGTLGLLTGLSLCPPFAAAITGAASTASTQGAVFYFWFFFAGTAVYFVPFTLVSPLTRRDAFRQVARVCLLLAGIWLVLEALVALVPYMPGLR
jgi:sulfite exporter TauE/SafE